MVEGDVFMDRACLGFDFERVDEPIVQAAGPRTASGHNGASGDRQFNGNKFASLVYHLYMALQALGPVGQSGG
jgi:hypothetical protein